MTRRGNPSAADRALSALRVVRGCVIGVREAVADAGKARGAAARRQALADAVEFADRAADRLDGCHAKLTAALRTAGISFRPGGQPQKRQKRAVRGNAPYGWRIRDGRLVESPAEQRALRRIRTLADDGLSPTGIAKGLNAAGFRNRKGRPWRACGVYNLLRRRRQ